jgi:NADPH:quinone reductase-like Zn-dependent oxidoreductase
MIKALALSPFVSQKFVTFLEKGSGRDLGVLKEMIEAESVTPVIDRTYPLSDAAEAVRYVEQGHSRGKVVVSV